MTDALPDLLVSGLKVVFCGTAAGTHSARIGAYYAGRGNKFWRALHEIGLTPRLLQPEEFRRLSDYGIGLTDIAKSYSGMDKGLKGKDFHRERLHSSIEEAAPCVLAFNGKRAAKVYYGTSADYGQQAENIAKTTIFVLPSTSGAANSFWSIAYWQQLADFLSKVE